MTTQQRLEIAEENYLKAVGIVKRIIDIRRGSGRYSREFGMSLSYFESAVQGVLLYAVFKTGNMPESAKRFIIDNNMSGDILSEINSIGLRKLFRNWIPLNWENIFSTGMPDETLAEIIKEAIRTSVQNFVFPIAQVDSDIESKSYSGEISLCIKTLIQAVCSADFSECPDADYETKLDMALTSMNAITEGIKVFNDAFLIYWKGSEEID